MTFVVGAIAALCLAMPNHLGVVAGFDDPCRFCAGSRSVIVATRSGDVVPAPVTGTVSYVGTVGGAPWIVVRSTEHPAVRVTLGGVGEVRVAAGDAVTIGEPIGTTATRLVVTLRDDDRYRDPSPWLLPGSHERRSVFPGSALPGSVLPESALPRPALPRSGAALVGQRRRPDSVGASIHHCAVPTSWSLRRAEP